jgi:hypothetical protein
MHRVRRHQRDACVTMLGVVQLEELLAATTNA